MQGEIFVPAVLTVHLGEPEQNARNLTLDFPDYIRTAASCELNPMEAESALRAALLSMVSFALHRFHSRFYRKQGYAFDITASRRQDFAFREDMPSFEPIRILTDELFNNCIVKIGTDEPLNAPFRRESTPAYAQFSLPDAAKLAAQKQTPYQILAAFFGNDIRIAENLPVQGCSAQFHGILSSGMSGNAVRRLQILLNRLSAHYSAIPKISPITGVYGKETESALRRFQEIFFLPPTGQADKATWYRLYFQYRRLQGSTENLPVPLHEGNANATVRLLQQQLNTAGKVYPKIPPVSETGYFGSLTKVSVAAFQREFGLPPLGSVNDQTWSRLSRLCTDIRRGKSRQPEQFPGFALREEMP